MICEITNKCDEFVYYSLTGNEWHGQKREFGLKEVVMTWIVTIFCAIFISPWAIPIILLYKLYEHRPIIRINWPVFKCKCKKENK